MPMVPVEWSVVIVGRWNRGILTPTGIITRLFEEPLGTPFSVEVPADAIGPPRVHHAGLMVTADWGRLVVELEENNFAQLGKAAAIAVIAIESLPVTPISAAGFNICYRTSLDDPKATQVVAAMAQNWDVQLERAGHSVVSREALVPSDGMVAGYACL